MPTDLVTAPWLDPLPSVIHLISDARRLATFEQEMETVRRARSDTWEPIICWEPEPVC